MSNGRRSDCAGWEIRNRETAAGTNFSSEAHLAVPSADCVPSLPKDVSIEAHRSGRVKAELWVGPWSRAVVVRRPQWPSVCLRSSDGE